jgi:Transcription initiation factor IIE, alpha subunit
VRSSTRRPSHWSVCLPSPCYGVINLYIQANLGAFLIRNQRSEFRDGSTRPVNREYYYIPLHTVIDGIKYKVSQLTSTIKAQYTPSEERKEYICLRCGAEWTELDVLSLVSEEGFECQNCGAILERTEDVKGVEGIDRTGHEKNSKLMAQLDNMLKLLKQIDSVEIPPNDFDTAWDHKVEVPRNQHTHPTRQAISIPVKTQNVTRTTAKTDAAQLEIALTSSEEKSAVEQAEEAARKAALEKQNALPHWHTHSTVSAINASATQAKNEAGIPVKPEEDGDQKPDPDALDDKVAAYYAEMEREKALQAEQDASSAEDSDEFDEEFEDVGFPAPVDQLPRPQELGRPVLPLLHRVLLVSSVNTILHPALLLHRLGLLPHQLRTGLR